MKTELKPELPKARPNWDYHSYYAQQLSQISSIRSETHHRRIQSSSVKATAISANSNDDLYKQQEAVIKKIHALAKTVGIQVNVFRK